MTTKQLLDVKLNLLQGVNSQGITVKAIMSFH